MAKFCTLTGLMIVLLFFLFQQGLAAQTSELKPFAGFEIQANKRCVDSVIRVTNLSNENLSFKWYVDYAYYSDSYHFEFQVAENGFHTIMLSVDSMGYTNTFREYVEIDRRLTDIDFYCYDTLLCRDESTRLVVYSKMDVDYFRVSDIIEKDVLYENPEGRATVIYLDSIKESKIIEVLGSNSCNSISDTCCIIVQPTPSDSLSYDFSERVFCNSGEPVLTVHNTDPIFKYTLSEKNTYYYPNTDPVDMGTGGDLVLISRELTQPKNFELNVLHPESGCYREYDLGRIVVDTVIAAFSIDKINSYTSSPVNMLDQSYGDPANTWMTIDGSDTIIQKDIKEFTFNYSTPGEKLVKLNNLTELGCRDSITGTVFIHDTSSYYEYGWEVSGGNMYDHNVRNRSMEVDSDGNIYITGTYDGDENIFSSTYGTSRINTEKEYGIYILKYDRYGVLLWRVIIEKEEDPADIKLVNDSLLMISCTGTANFVGADNVPHYIRGYRGVLSLSAEGRLVSYFETDRAVLDIAVDSKGNYFFLESGDSFNPYKLIKYNEFFDTLWYVEFDDSDWTYNLGYSLNEHLKIDSNDDVIVSASFISSGFMTVIATNGEYKVYDSRTDLHTAPGCDLFVVKLSEEGGFLWSNICYSDPESNSVDQSRGVELDSHNNVYVLLNLPKNYPITIESQDQNTYTLNVDGGLFLKFDSEGNYIYGTGVDFEISSGGNWLGVNRLVIDSSDNLHLSGYVNNNCSFVSSDGGKDFYFFDDNEDRVHFFVANFSPDGIAEDFWTYRPPPVLVELSDFFVGADTAYFILRNERNYALRKYSKYFDRNFTGIRLLGNTSEFCKNDHLLFEVEQHDTLFTTSSYLFELSDSKGSFYHPLLQQEFTFAEQLDTIEIVLPDSIEPGGYYVRMNNLTQNTVGKRSDDLIDVSRYTYQEKYHYLCSDESVVIDGQEFFNDTVIVQILESDAGCDTLISHVIDINRSSMEVSVCDFYISPSSKYMYTNTGVYQDTLPGSVCDSIITIYLKVNRSAEGEILATACDHYIAPSGKIFNNSGIFYDTISTIQGCDSVVKIDLTMHETEESTDVVFACDSFTWIDGITYTEENSQADWTLQNIYGCDSIVNLDLTIGNSFYKYYRIDTCESYKWIDSGTYFEDTNKTINALTVNSCDSIHELDLTIRNSSWSELSIQIKDNEKYVSPGGNEYSQQGVYFDTITNQVGCDSIIQINLTVLSGLSNELSLLDKLYPNPADEVLQIQLGEVFHGLLVVADIRGKILIERMIEDQEIISLDISRLPAGMYNLRILNEVYCVSRIFAIIH